VTFSPSESVTASVIVPAPAVVGVPLIAPLFASIWRPVGSVPPSIVHLYAGFPPVAFGLRRYGSPTSAVLRAAVIESFGTTDIEYVCVSLRPPDVAVILNVK